MPIAQALYTGVTGLSVNSDNMGVIANNIANANAIAFKRDRAEFEDMVSHNLKSGRVTTHIGRGSRLANVRTMHTQGGMKVTDNLTDLAIQGRGFFVIKHPAEIDATAGKFYTRVGNLQFDKEGYFATPSGDRVQGYAADAAGQLSSKLTDIRIETNTIAPKETDKVTMNVQLDSRDPIIKEEFDFKRPEDTSNFNSSVTIFDSQGGGHQATVFFRRVETEEEGVQWEWHALADGKEVIDPDGEHFREFASGVLNFDKNGFLSKEKTFFKLTNILIVNFDTLLNKEKTHYPSILMCMNILLYMYFFLHLCK